MLHRFHRALTIGVLIGAVAIAAPAGATTINPGDLVSPVTATGGCPCSGPFLEFHQNAWSVGAFSGVLVNAVYDRGGGLLDFMYQLGTDENSQAVQDLVMSSFTGFATDVFAYNDFDSGSSGGKNPDSASRSASGSLVTFDFASGVLAGERSNVLVIRTDASSYTSGEVLIQSVSSNGLDIASTTVRTFAPVATPVPEPATLVLSGLGLAGVLARRRRRRQQAGAAAS